MAQHVEHPPGLDKQNIATRVTLGGRSGGGWEKVGRQANESIEQIVLGYFLPDAACGKAVSTMCVMKV